MGDDHTDPTGEVPEADLIDQRATLDGALNPDPEEAFILDRSRTDGLVDEADRLEQMAQLPDDDDDDGYPHDPPPADRT